MGSVKKISLMIVFLLVVEVIYLGHEPLSFGFPFRSVQYKPDYFPGMAPPSAETGWPAVFRVDPILLVCDVTVTAILVLLLMRYVPPAVLVPVTKGGVLGSVAGAVTLGLEGTVPEPWASVALVLVVFIGVPLAVYALSLGHKRQKTIIIVLACVTLPALIRVGFTVEGMIDGGFEGIPISLELVLRYAAAISVLVCACFVLMVLHKRLLPVIWRKKQAVLPAPTVHGISDKIASPLEQRDSKSKMRIAFLYTLLMAIIIYFGWHFMIIRKMREDPFVISDVIYAEFVRLEVPFSGAYSFTTPQGDSELLKPGWKVSYPVEIEVNRKSAYEAEIKKSIFVPWIQVKINKKESSEQTDNQQTSDEEKGSGAFSGSAAGP